MEVFQNSGNKELDIKLEDFPFICRICLRRGDLRLFEDEDYLLNIFVTITKIDVHSTANFPRNICNKCINKLEDISLFIDYSKYNPVESQEKNLIPKSTEGFEICRICMLPSCLTPFEEKENLMQLFQNITNIDVEAETDLSKRNNICNKCINKLEKISLFINLSLDADTKLKNTVERNESLNFFENTSFDENEDMKFERISDRNGIKVESNFNENVCCYENKDLHSVLDIKEDLHMPEASVSQNTQNDLDILTHTRQNLFKNTVEVNEALKTKDCKENTSFDDSKDIKFESILGRNRIKVENSFSKNKNVCCYENKDLHSVLDIKDLHSVLDIKEDLHVPEASVSQNTQNDLEVCSDTNSAETPLGCNPCENECSTENCMKMFPKGLEVNSEAQSITNEFECDCCEKRFNHRTTLKRHMLTHTAQKPFKNTVEVNEALKTKDCKENTSFDDSKDMKFESILDRNGIKVENNSSENKNVCCYENKDLHSVLDIKEDLRMPEASVSQNTENDLEVGSDTNSAETPLGCNPCENECSTENCMKMFPKGLEVNSEAQSITNEFECDRCEKRFNHRTTLKRHMLTHTAQKPFKNTVEGNEALKTKDCKENTSFDDSKDMKFESILDRNGIKVENNSSENKNVCCYENKDLHSVLDIKEDLRMPEASVSQNTENDLEVGSDTNSVETPLGCDPCENEFSTENCMKILPKGLEVNSEGQPVTKEFECDRCQKRFNHRTTLKRHMLTHTGQKLFKCNRCKKSFSAGSILNKHLLTHTGEKRFKCNICEKRFNHRTNLTRHMHTHTRQKSFNCKRCKKSFAAMSILKNHLLTHASEKPFKCNICEKSFRLKSNLKTHLFTHTGQKPFKCDRCEKKFVAKQLLEDHYLVIHTGQRPFKCDRCEKSFALKQRLKTHLLSHTEKKTLKCDFCERRFRWKSHLQSHIVSVHTVDKKFKCDYCKKGFARLDSFQNHLRIHTGLKPFKCDFCDTSCYSKSSLANHMVIHTGEKSFKCIICEYSFYQNADLQKHILTHTGEKSFNCDYCEKKFARKDVLKNHLLTHSVDKPFNGEFSSWRQSSIFFERCIKHRILNLPFQHFSLKKLFKYLK